MSYEEYKKCKQEYLQLKLIGGGTLTSKSDYFTKPISITDFDPKKDLVFDLSKDYPRAIYVYNGKIIPDIEYKSSVNLLEIKPRNLHWGQMKLLLSEIRFLTELASIRDHIIVYAGAADGRHIPLLLEMFGLQIKEIHLYDPRKFYPKLYHNDKIKINLYSENGFFTDDVAEIYKKEKILFISDIRTEPTEEEVINNQAAQKKWIEIMQPVASMLKFKLPYPALGKSIEYKYLQGTIELQCWAPNTSAETRLVSYHAATAVHPYQDTQYNILDYERQLSWYNLFARLSDLRQYKEFESMINWWKKYVPDEIPKGSDFYYHWKILNDYVEITKIKDTRYWMKRILSVLTTKPKTFIDYLKS